VKFFFQNCHFFLKSFTILYFLIIIISFLVHRLYNYIKIKIFLVFWFRQKLPVSFSLLFRNSSGEALQSLINYDVIILHFFKLKILLYSINM